MTAEIWKIKSCSRGNAQWNAHYLLRTRESGVHNRSDLIQAWHGNLPFWADNNPLLFFEMSDKHERRNGCAGRHLILALPRGQSLDQWVSTVQRYVDQDLGGKSYLCAIHSGEKSPDGGGNPHVHILYSDRMPDKHPRDSGQYFSRYNPAAPQLGGAKKDSGGRNPLRLRIEINKRRQLWASVQGGDRQNGAFGA